MGHTTLSKSNRVILRAAKIKNGYSLYLDIHFKHKRIREYLQIYLSSNDKRRYTAEDRNKLKIAEQIKAQRILELSNGVYNDPKTQSVIVADYISHHVEKRFKAQRPDRYRWHSLLKHFHEYFKPGLTFEEITTKDLDGFQEYLLNNLSQNTAHDYFVVLNQIFNIAFREGIIVSNPVAKLFERIKKAKTNPTYLTFEEILKLHNTPYPVVDIRLAFLFCCFASLRFSDCKRLKWNNIRNINEEYQINFFQSKTKTFEWQPLSKQAVKYLPEKSDSEYVFSLYNDHAVNDHLRRWAALAGIDKHLTFHVSRHTFATLALTSGIELKTVSELMGHAEIRTTEIYARIINEKKREAVNRLPEI